MSTQGNELNGIGGFWKAYVTTVTKKYATFSGRSSRGEYWRFVATNIVVAMLIAYVGSLVSISSTDTWASVYQLLLFLPTVAISVRRLHDVNKSGWLYLLNLIPLIGTLWLLYLYVQPGDVGENRFGEDPL